jgi:hypothetical protein
VHAEGEMLALTHVEEGTLIEARVPAGLAAQLEAGTEPRADHV